MKPTTFVFWPSFLAVGIITVMAVRAAMDWYGALEKQEGKEEEDCPFFRHHPSLR